MGGLNSRRGGILLGLLAAAFAFVCLAVAGAILIARNVHVETSATRNGDSVSLDTPAGRLSVRAHERPGAGAAGVPLYPGARRVRDSGGDAVFEWEPADGKDHGFAVSASAVVTSDPIDQVVSYYQNQLPDWIIVHEKNGAVRLELHDGGYKRIIAIRERYDGTHIGVAAIGEPASN